MERAVVTGAAAGIGQALADRLHAEGARVWRADIQGDPPVDVTDEAQLAALMAAARPDVLVNCAGGIPAGASELDILDLNLRAALRATELSSARVVIHIASVAGIDDGPHPSPAYAAAKAGLVRFTTAYAGPVRMNCIVPGWIATARGLREREQMTPEERDAAGPMVSMDAIADAMMALLRDEAARSRVVVIR